MPTYLYCLLPAPSDRPAHPPSIDAPGRTVLPAAGIGGAPVRELRGDGVVAWVSDVVVSDLNDRDIRSEHARIVQAALASGETPLPARVGQTFPDDDALSSELEAKSQALSGALSRLRGMVEMTLVVHLPRIETSPSSERQDSPTGSGRDYLERLRAEHGAIEREQRLGESIRAAAKASMAHVVEADTVVTVRGQGRFVISHLVKRERVEEWRSRATALSIDGARRTFIAGPLPPYSFASLDRPPVAEQRDSPRMNRDEADR